MSGPTLEPLIWWRVSTTGTLHLLGEHRPTRCGSVRHRKAVVQAYPSDLTHGDVCASCMERAGWVWTSYGWQEVQR